MPRAFLHGREGEATQSHLITSTDAPGLPDSSHSSVENNGRPGYEANHTNIVRSNYALTFSRALLSTVDLPLGNMLYSFHLCAAHKLLQVETE